MLITEKLHGVLFHQIKWVDEVARNDDVRPFCRCLHIKGRTIMATDGHRMHTVTVPDESIGRPPLDNPDRKPLLPIDWRDGSFVVATRRKTQLHLIEATDPSQFPPERAWRLLDIDNDAVYLPFPQPKEPGNWGAPMAWWAAGIIQSEGRLNSNIGVNMTYLIDACDYACQGVHCEKDRIILAGPGTNAVIMGLRMPQ
jgi:hypothetical protein